MAIRPTGPGGPSQSGPGPLQESRGSLPVRPEEMQRRSAQAPAAGADNAEISSAARQLQEQLGVDSKALSEIPSDRLKEVLKRMLEGYYDKPEAQTTVAKRIASDLGLPAKG